MNPAWCVLTAAWLPTQCIDASVQPPHQPLWTCSSMLKCCNVMTCHEVGEVSLPILDCVGHICDTLCPRKRRHQVRFRGINTAPIYYHTGWPGCAEAGSPGQMQ